MTLSGGVNYIMIFPGAAKVVFGVIEVSDMWVIYIRKLGRGVIVNAVGLLMGSDRDGWVECRFY